MSYTLQWGQVTPYIPYLMGGAWLALQLAAIGFVCGMAIGVTGAAITRFGPRWARGLVRAYVVFFLNTPLLVQIFFLFFALPDAGILLGPYTAVLIGLALNEGAYLTEINRAGFDSMRREELEAAETLGMSRVQTVWYVILPHIVRVLYPPLANQYIILTMTTSIAAIFGVEELTGRAYNINAKTFRSFEVFSLAALHYIALTVIASLVLMWLGRALFRVRAKVF